MKSFVIRHVRNDDTYWSDAKGWVNLPEATHYTQAYRDAHPITLTPIMGVWWDLDEVNPVVPVIFRADKKDGDVTAVFPTDPATYDGETMGCYAHLGQHGQCSLAWYNTDTRPATPAEYADLKAELERPPYGYRFKVYKHYTRGLRDVFRAEVRKMRSRNA